MKNIQLLAVLIFTGASLTPTVAGAQQSLWFGTVGTGGKTSQGRFEVAGDSVITSIVYAPYGISPTLFGAVRHQQNRLTFTWQVDQSTYRCLLLKQGTAAYTGSCISANRQPIQLTIRQFTKEDAILQGDSLHASPTDIRIPERALNLLGNGTNWSRSDRRVCDGSAYPYQWSLFCALHQASIDVDGEYRHLRPALQAARQAINEATAGKQYAHLLQDFNNEATSFDAIAQVLNRAKAIIAEKIRVGQ